MKKLCLFVSLCAAALLAATASGTIAETAWIKGTTDKCPLEYQLNETMVFTLEPRDLGGVPPAGEYFLQWTRTGDDGLKEEGKVSFDGKPFVYRTRLDRAGFVRLYAVVVDAKGVKFRKRFTGDATTPEGKEAMNRFERQSKDLFFDGGAGVKIDTLASVPEPKDFDAFWARHRVALKAVPLTGVKEVKVDESAVATVYAVTVPCAGPRPVTGYLSVPKRKDRKHPAVLSMHGYGEGKIHKPMPARNPGELWFDINAHGYELGREKAYYDAFYRSVRSNGHSYAMDPAENADPEKAYFCGMTYRVLRALEYLKSRPDWNGKDLIATGGSQGGLQAVWAGGLDPDVTRVDTSITWCCDMGGETLGRNRGTWYVHWTPALGYYDPVNVAKRIPKTCFVNIARAGLGDYICPPTGLAILWNSVSAPKRIKWVQGAQHGYVPPAYEGRDIVREAGK